MFRFAAYLIPLAILLGVLYYIYDTQSTIKSIVSENTELKAANIELQQDLISLKTSIEFQITQLNSLNSKIEESNRVAQKNLKALEDSDLNRLSNSKPVLIERIINQGTQELFKEFENESR